jgi:cation transport ATPase
MTGEGRPVSRGPGDRVLAGTFSIDGSFEIRAAGGARRLDAIFEAVSEARLAPSRLQLQADRLMAWFLPLVVGVSLATFAWWIMHGSWDRALFNAMAVLLVACPCAMGLATPVAVWSGLARLTQIGLVARTGDFLDVLARVDMLCIDKTGTLSEAMLSVKAWRIEPAFREQTVWLKVAVTTVEQGLAHPVAEALRGKCHVISDTLLKAPEVRERRIVPGLGVVAEVEAAGARSWMLLAIGEAGLVLRKPNGLVQENAAVAPADGKGDCHGLGDTATGKTVYVFVDGVLAAQVELEESWRTGLSETFDELLQLGVAIEVLSGDSTAVAALSDQIAPTHKPLDVDNLLRGKPSDGEGLCGERGKAAVYGGVTPARKQARVEALVHAGRTVLFVGDGLNDAGALSVAQGSIAMRGGADLARASSMAVFVGDDLRFLPRAIRLARATRRSIRANLLFAGAYNIAGMALAAGGVLHPVVAALLMLGSSLFVSVNSLRTSRGIKFDEQ